MNEAIKQHIEDYIKENDTTRSAFAQRIGISRSSLYEKTEGIRPWLLSEAIAISEVIGCTIPELVASDPEQEAQ